MLMWPLLGSLVRLCRRGRYVEGLRELFEVLELVVVVDCRALLCVKGLDVGAQQSVPPTRLVVEVYARVHAQRHAA